MNAAEFATVAVGIINADSICNGYTATKPQVALRIVSRDKQVTVTASQDKEVFEAVFSTGIYMRVVVIRIDGVGRNKE
jgi:hypothetical protein